ncbi:uncharacterized protein LOC124656011 [Lolium rigidum]|uniref:uncharacterized protein LOC124656011 n=1 Tax=Lolium rigidum TaxID=89674 RepID=UPI001F5DD0B3|nr:uncharacterized protein LOC124656011 [Lolium rigidum]
MVVTELAASRDEEAAALLASADAGDARRGAGASSETRDTHLLSSAFFFVFLAYHAAQNLQSTVNTDGDLGTISLGFLYTSFTAFSVVGSPVVRRMGSRRALVLGTSGYLLFIAANLAPSWYVHTHATDRHVAGSGCFCCNFCVAEILPEIAVLAVVVRRCSLRRARGWSRRGALFLLAEPEPELLKNAAAAKTYLVRRRARRRPPLRPAVVSILPKFSPLTCSSLCHQRRSSVDLGRVSQFPSKDRAPLFNWLAGYICTIDAGTEEYGEEYDYYPEEDRAGFSSSDLTGTTGYEYPPGHYFVDYAEDDYVE